MSFRRLISAAFLLAIGTAPSYAQSISVDSPDHQVRAEVHTSPDLNLTVVAHGKTVVEKSALGLDFEGVSNHAWHVKSQVRHAVNSAWHPVVGRFSTVRDQCNELDLNLIGGDGAAPAQQMQLQVRAYNDGLAFRYVLPASSTVRKLTAERTAFRFAADADCWAAPKDGAYETEYPLTRLSRLSSSPVTSLPLTVRLAPDLYCALTEADLVNYPGAYLAGPTAAAAGEKLFASPVLRGTSQPLSISVPVAGFDTITLHIGDGGDDFTFDHADWADARLIAADGTSVKLSLLTPIAASLGFGSLQRGKSIDGNTITLAGKTYADGLGTHSVGNVTYALPGKFVKLEATVGIDAETGGKGSATFEVFGAHAGAKPGGAVTLNTALAPRVDGAGLALLEANKQINCPWRVLMIAQKPGDLAANEMVENLSRPCAIPDTAWIRPGMMAWDHWWSGDVKMTTDENLKFIQFAGEMGWPYQLVDWQWYGSFDNPNADITRPNSAIDFPAMLQAASKAHVRLWVWLHSNDVNRYLKAGKLDDAFDTYHKWGLAGVKIDFMNRDDQEMVEWYETIVKMAARHQLMVDFHGAFKPTGLRRTYPNLMTREGVLGNEYNKFSKRVTPEHTLILPFTRMLAGPMDFTPGGFNNTTQAQFMQAVPAQVMGTRAHQLAMFVVYDSPVTCFCEDPQYCRNAPGIEFLRAFPCSWDETRIVQGEIGKQIVSLRRKGAVYYAGGMCGPEPVTIKLDLAFLGKGTWTAEIYRDVPDSGTQPTKVAIETRSVKASDRMELPMASAGGFAIRFKAETR